MKSTKMKRFKSTAMFTFVGGVMIINPAFAQDAASAQQDATTLDTVVVTGMRSSLDQAMNIKRDTPGIVDAISAEDIGKFPDANLAESLQRVTGISIERRDGEGATITARGFGPNYNMVTLNGRHQAVEVKIDPKAVDVNDLSLLEDLMRAAYNQAAANLAEGMQQRLGGLAQGFGLDLNSLGLGDNGGKKEP